MSTYYNESLPQVEEYQAPQAEYGQYPAPEYEAPQVEYKYYQEYTDYQYPEGGYEAPEYDGETGTDYWTPTYGEIQEKYSEEAYPEKQYLPEAWLEGYGSEAAEYMVANEYDNTIATYEGYDVIEAGYGNDKIDAGAGDDLIWGISPEHNPEDEYYSSEEYTQVDWFTGGEGKDVYALGTEEYAHYASNTVQDYAVLTDYTAGEDTVMLHGTTDNYVVGAAMSIHEDESLSETVAALYWDTDGSGTYSAGDDMVAIFEGYTPETLAAAKDSFLYVAPEPSVDY